MSVEFLLCIGTIFLTAHFTSLELSGRFLGHRVPSHAMYRPNDLSVVGSYRLRSWRLGASFVYATGQAFTPAAARYTLRDPATGVAEDRVLAAARNSARLLPYHRLDASVRRELSLFGARGTAYLQVFNLYSRRNEWFVQYDTDDPQTQPEVVKQLPVVPTFGLELEL